MIRLPWRGGSATVVDVDRRGRPGVIWLLRLVGPRALLLAVLSAVVADLAGTALIGAATWLLVCAAQRPELAALSLGIVGVRAAAMMRGLARYGERLTSHDAALGALAGLRDRVYRALAARSSTEQHSANALGAAVHDVDAVQDLVVRCVVPFAGALLVSCASTGVVWWLSPAAGPVLAGGLLVALVVVPAIAGLRSRRSDRLIAADRAALTARVIDLFRGAAELAVTGTGAAARASVATEAAQLTRRQRSAPALGATSAILLIAGCTAVGTLVVGVTADPTTTGRITSVVLTLVVLAAFEVCGPLPAAARQLARIAGSVRRIRTLTDPRPTPHRGELALPPGPPELRLTHVGVRYRAAETPALTDIDLYLPPGRRIAVVGASGSGKSTLLATVARFAEPTSGHVTLGGTDLAAWPESRLRGTVGGVLADAHVFHDTIAANLRIGRPDATESDLVAVAARMRLLPWIESLPDGWHTVLGEDAALASGGQRRRLLLARALLARPPVLLLDEPTEGLDAETADAVLADLLSATVGHTVVLVTHRLAGLADFDEVVLLDGGRIRQRGPHHELATRTGPYRDLWRVREVVG